MDGLTSAQYSEAGIRQNNGRVYSNNSSVYCNLQWTHRYWSEFVRCQYFMDGLLQKCGGNVGMRGKNLEEQRR